jgi:hypothetical protein
MEDNSKVNYVLTIGTLVGGFLSLLIGILSLIMFSYPFSTFGLVVGVVGIVCFNIVRKKNFNYGKIYRDKERKENTREEGYKQMVKITIMSGIGVVLILFKMITFDGYISKSTTEYSCGCKKRPDIGVGLIKSFDDVQSNWVYKECTKVEKLGQRIHIFLYYNQKLDKYRCEMRYSEPDWLECHMSGGMWGDKSLTTLTITKSDVESGKWKTFEFIEKENGLSLMGY